MGCGTEEGIVVKIEELQELYQHHQVYISTHADAWFRQRGIRARDVRNCVMNGLSAFGAGCIDKLKK